MKFLLAGLLLLATMLLSSFAVAADSLTVSYLERPPYYYRDSNGEVAGFLAERTQKILAAANLDAQFVNLEPSQIMFLLHRASAAHCSIGWLKTDKRQLFAKFTLPIYQDQKPVLLLLRSRRHKFPNKITLETLFADRQLTIARLGQFSYGDLVDSLMETLSPVTLFRSSEQVQLLQAIYSQQADYMLVSPEEIAMLIRSSGLPKEEFISLPLQGAPDGNLRYLMCGQGVSDESMQRLNAAISKLYPTPKELSLR